MNNKFPVGNYNCNARYVMDVPQFDLRQTQEFHGCLSVQTGSGVHPGFSSKVRSVLFTRGKVIVA